MADASPQWYELLAVVRHCENGEPLPESAQRAALQLATSIGLQAVPGAVACSITLQRPDGTLITPAAAGPVAMILDGVQYGTDDGPCVRAARTGQAERLDALAQDDRWPELVLRAREQGVHSSLSLPLTTSPSPAALNLYGSAVGVFATARAGAVAGVIARATSTLLMDVGGSSLEGMSPTRVRQVLSDRTLIFRAQGVLMAGEGLNAVAAYRALAVRSGVEELPLREVARRVLEAAEARSGSVGRSHAGSGPGEDGVA